VTGSDPAADADGLYVGDVFAEVVPGARRPIVVRFLYEYGPGRQTGVWHADRLTSAQAASLVAQLSRSLGLLPP
jgi:hypothetical protein